MMGKRKWMHLQEWQQGKAPQMVHRVRCGNGDCGETHTIRNLRTGAKLSAQIVEKKLRQLGWSIGHRPADDRCPKCVKGWAQKIVEDAMACEVPPAPAPAPEPALLGLSEAAKAFGVPMKTLWSAKNAGRVPVASTNGAGHPLFRPADVEAFLAVRRPKPKPDAQPDAQPEPEEPAVPPQTVQTLSSPSNTAQVREPTRDQRRRVLEALDEVYPKAEQGYSGGMSDELLSRRLDVPRAWVSKLREELYGPEFIVDVRSFQTRLAMLEQQYQAMEASMLEQLGALSEQIKAARREVEAVARQVGVKL